MKKTSFAIVHPSDMLRRGIATIIEQIPHATLIAETARRKGIRALVVRQNPDYLILDPEALGKKQFEKLVQMQVKIIAVADQKPDWCIENISVQESEKNIVEKLAKLPNEQAQNTRHSKNELDLTRREINIVKLIASGYTNKEIAEELFISTHTVVTHRKNITKKLGIKTVSGLTIYAILNDIISLEEAPI